MKKFNFNIDDINQMGNLSKSTNDTILLSDAIKSLIISLGFVDMGLSSGTLWSEYNLGVDKENLSKAKDWYGGYHTNLSKAKDWYGGYYAWGEDKEKPAGRSYDWKTYKHTKNVYEMYTQVSKYCVASSYGKVIYENPDNITQLEPEDDAAYMNSINDNWKQNIPTMELMKELIESCTVNYIEEYNGIITLNVAEFISNINGNKLIFPFAGQKYNNGYDIEENTAAYWTSTLKTPKPDTMAHTDCNWSYALILSKYESDRARIGNRARKVGLPIRPVITL